MRNKVAHQHKHYGDLDIIEINQGVPKPSIIIIHGYGANYHDLLSLPVEMDQLDCNWYFPNGCLESHSSGDSYHHGRAWFHVDLVAMNAARAGRQEQEFMDHEPAGLSEAREKLFTSLKLIQDAGSLGDKIFLGGFSQGAMMALDLAIYADFPVSGLLLFSGALINRKNYRNLLQKKETKPPFFQSHGTDDNIIPYRAGHALTSFLQESQFIGDLVTFNDGHTIPPKIVHQAQDFIQRRFHAETE